VTFLGLLSRPAVLARMRGARAVVLPSECYENAPMTALEALGSGVPVIGADIGGVPEIVRDGETGLLFAPGSADELSDRLARLRDDAALAHRLGRAGRGVVEREYRLTDQTDRMLELLAEVSSSASR
jgi:glycosyltransferase involved in cell wall biosynthesis